MARLLYDSIHGRLLTLPESVEIFPGHLAGSVCAAGVSGKPSSTIGFEKRRNPGLTMAKEAFVGFLTSEIPRRPVDIDRIIAANLGGGTP